MCGIAGVLRASDAALDAVPRVMELLEHRGPDDRGFLTLAGSQVAYGRNWPVGDVRRPDLVLLHRRLSILDLTSSGWQPMSSSDGRFWMVFNGEIYNFVELRADLEAIGHRFRSNSDTEVLLAAYQRWGRSCLDRLVGMFAFAILDLKKRNLFLARDFFGIKPLYYTVGNGSFAFASEVTALLDFGDHRRTVNPARLYLYLRYGIGDHGAETMLSEIKQVPAGHFLEVELDQEVVPEPCCYWTPRIGETIDISFEEAAGHTRDLFLDNIRLHLRSDVEVGAALSGGVDSSSIVMAMRHLNPRLEIHAFSYIAEDQNINEERWIDQIGREGRLEIHKVRPSAEDLLADLDPLTRAQDEPFGSTSLYAQYCVFRAAHQAGIKVMLDGQGADEILGGYRYYMGARLASLVRKEDWVGAVRFLSLCSQWPGVTKWGLITQSSNYLLPTGVQEPLRKLIGKDLSPPWMQQSWFLSRGVEPKVLNYSDQPDVLRDALLRTLVQTSLPHLLRYEDRNSMAFSVESRVPFLTPELVNFMLSLPEQYMIADDGTSKAVFRRAMAGIVPDAILDRRDKIGFATPEKRWLSKLDIWVRGVLTGDVARTIPFFNVGAISAEWQSVLDGRKAFDFRIWRWLNLIQWAERLGVEYN